LTISERSVTEAYIAAVNFASMPGFSQQMVTKSEYTESGSNASRKKFHDWSLKDMEKELVETEKPSKGKQREDDRSLGPNRLTRTRSRTSTSSLPKRR
jgi:actin-related protein 6